MNTILLLIYEGGNIHFFFLISEGGNIHIYTLVLG